MSVRPVLQIDGRPLTVGQVVAVATRAVQVRLTAQALDRARRSAELGTRVGRERLLYGRDTGVGANRTVVVPGDPVGQDAHADRLLRSHATSSGPVRSAERVRALAVVRLNQLAAGGSGVAPQVLGGLAELVNGARLPEVRERGGIGTGDLTVLAAIALELTAGSGAPGTRGYRAPVHLGASDALAFLSSNAAAIGDAALAAADLAESASAAVGIAVLTLRAVRGNLEAFSPAAERATPLPGAIAVCRAVRALAGPVAAARIQDPFALRTLPQVHGPLLDSVRGLSALVATLTAASAENPLLLPGTAGQPDLVGHHGGFHAAYLHHALAGCAIALAQSARSVQARLTLLCEPAYTGLPPFLSDGTPGASGVMTLEYVASSAAAEITAGAVPPGLHTAVLSRGTEEDASFAPQAASRLADAVRAYREMLACELVAAIRALRALGSNRAAGSAGARTTLDRDLPEDVSERASLDPLMMIGSVLPSDAGDRILTADLDLARSLIPGLAALVGPLAPAADGD